MHRRDSQKTNRGSGIRMRCPRHRMLAVAMVLSLAVAGCGWRPLYERPVAEPASGGGVGAVLAQIAIDPISTDSTPDPLTGSDQSLYDSRAAQLLQNNLKNLLNPGGAPDSTMYHLAIQLEQQTDASASLGNGQTTREDLTMIAKYQLNDTSGQPVLSDFARAVTSYDILRQPFADISSRRDAQQRGAQELARSIQTRLSVFLRK
jgi:LPS-assembly lipoprotein